MDLVLVVRPPDCYNDGIKRRHANAGSTGRKMSVHAVRRATLNRQRLRIAVAVLRL